MCTCQVLCLDDRRLRLCAYISVDKLLHFNFVKHVATHDICVGERYFLRYVFKLVLNVVR